MYLLSEPVEAFADAYDIYRRKLDDLLQDVAPSRPGVLVPLDSSELSQVLAEGHCFALREGLLKYSLAGRDLFFLEEGDLVGLTEASLSSMPVFDFNFAVKVDVYSKSDFAHRAEEKEAVSEAWCNLLLLTASSLTQAEGAANPNIRHFKAGAEIIREGAVDSTVYTLVEGHADVFVEGVKVGEVLPDEIFGALAALTASPRTATVRASRDCLVLMLPKDNFVELLRWRPQTVVKMVEDMARTVVSLNRKVVRLEKDSKPEDPS